MEFIKDNWYKSKQDNYYRFDKLENDYYYFSEYIYNKIWMVGVGWEWSGWAGVMVLFEKIDLQEIQEYLPLDHPDKSISNIENKIEDLSYLITLFKNLNIK